MKMTILERDDGITHVVLTGRLDTTGTADIEDVFSAATTARQRSAIVDLSEIDFLASRNWTVVCQWQEPRQDRPQDGPLESPGDGRVRPGDIKGGPDTADCKEPERSNSDPHGGGR